MFEKYKLKSTWVEIFIKNIDNLLENFVSLLLTVLGIWLAIYSNTSNKLNADLEKAQKDFSDIATMTKQRLQSCSNNVVIGRGLDTEEYKRTLQLNYKLHSSFILKELKYKNFEEFWRITTEINKENECEKLKLSNIEIDKLFDYLVK